METADQMKEQLEMLRKQRTEIESVLVKHRENVVIWLESVSRACLRECWQLTDNGEIADGEIQVPWELMQESIAQLRETQDLMRMSSDTIHELEAELLEAEYPF